MPEEQPTAEERQREYHREYNRKYNPEYYQKHREELLQKQRNRSKESKREASRRSNQKHREARNQQTRERRHEQRKDPQYREKIRQQHKQDYRKHRAKRLIAQKKYNEEHKAERKATMKKWRKAHPETMRIYSVKQQAAIRAREHQAPGRFKTRDVRELLELQQGKCAICQNAFPPPGTLRRYDVDHIVPMSQGGSNTRDNIQLLCSRCNRHKRFEQHQ
jgi:hypothetical protein